MTDTHHPPYWSEHMLAMIGAPRRHENLRLLAAWSQAEGGTARWNPLNTTRYEPDYTGTDYNGAGVRQYTSPIAGVCATVLTLIGRDSTGKLRYGGIIADLQAGQKTAEQIVTDRAAQFQIWGTSPQTISDVLAETP